MNKKLNGNTREGDIRVRDTMKKQRLNELHEQEAEEDIHEFERHHACNWIQRELDWNEGE